MGKIYEVKMMLQSQIFRVFAKDEDEAFDIAYQTLISNSPADLVKWADYEIEEVGE